MKPIFTSLIIFLFSYSYAQQTQYIDIKKGTVNITIDPDAETVSGEVIYTFKVIEITDSLVIDARNMEIKSLSLNDKELAYSNTGSQLIINKTLKPRENNSLKIAYKASPKKALYFVAENNNDQKQIWTQGQGKYTSNWLPSFDDMNEKVEFDLSITTNSLYKVMANGKLIDKKVNNNTTSTWKFDMQHPMSSYLVALAIGNYNVKEEVAKSGIPLQQYYSPEDEKYVTSTYKHSKRIFDYLEEEIGVPFPWQNYKQVPVKDFLYAGMENTSLTIFSDSYLVDSIGFVDRNYINVNAHELVHQWFGDLVTEESSTHHWLQEGFATYYALLAEREIFGDDYFYEQLYNSAKQLEALNDNGGESLLNPKASSLTFYQRGAWAVFALRKKIGDRAFEKSVKKYLKDYAYKNANTHDFINIAAAKSQIKLEDFVEKWLVNTEFPLEEAEQLLLDNKTSKTLLALDAMSKEEVVTYAQNNSKIFTSEEQSAIATHILKRLIPTSEVEKAIFLAALQSEVLKTRQAVALYMNPIPEEFKTDFEKLLSDGSYLTIEKALMKLWVSFPFIKDRAQFLDQTKGITGFRDKNVETLWLTLALITENYHQNDKKEYYDTLVSYTDPKQHYEVRQHAFQYLYQIKGFDEAALKSLIQACKHPVWQFSKFSRQLLEELITDKDYRIVLEGIVNDLPSEEKVFLEQKLKR
ncbi:M1 family metallopeptidase [Joostella sp.]|uniref:M1 family metallopeptidase n=1 Tax=Joostella sp. TaxID=2231138 RepID=UPI003A8D8650